MREDDQELGPVLAVQGMNFSDMGDYPSALSWLEESVSRADQCGDRRQIAFSLSLLGRARLLRGEMEEATAAIDRCLEIAKDEHWLAFQPWPQILQGEVEIRDGEILEASTRLEHAFALACQVGDPCWEGLGARAIGVLDLARGDDDQALGWLEQARSRCTRVVDSYVWAHAQILDTLAELAVRRGDGSASALVDTLSEVAGRTNMKELVVRSLVHRGHLDTPEALVSANALAAEIENPELHRWLRQRGERRGGRAPKASRESVAVAQPCGMIGACPGSC